MFPIFSSLLSLCSFFVINMNTIDLTDIPDAPDSAAPQGTVLRRGKEKRDAPAKHWCFTLNNPTVPCSDFTKLLSSSAWPTSYAVYQKETGASGTPHFQGYVEFNKKMTFVSVKRLLPNAHWEKRKGSPSDARDYCMKDEGRLEGPFEVGTWVDTKQGKRTDLTDVAEMIKDGSTIHDIASTYTESFIKYSKGIVAAQLYLGPREREPVNVTLCFGKPGTGKSYMARHGLDLSKFYSVEPGNGSTWWDRYDGESRIIFDDFDGARSKVALRDFLRWIDIYSCQVPVKGGFTQLTGGDIWVTSMYHPSQWYEWEGREHLREALYRRFHRVLWFTGVGFEFETLDPTSTPDRWATFWKGPKEVQRVHSGGVGPMDLYCELEEVNQFRW